MMAGFVDPEKMLVEELRKSLSILDPIKEELTKLREENEQLKSSKSSADSVGGMEDIAKLIEKAGINDQLQGLIKENCNLEEKVKKLEEELKENQSKYDIISGINAKLIHENLLLKMKLENPVKMIPSSSLTQTIIPTVNVGDKLSLINSKNIKIIHLKPSTLQKEKSLLLNKNPVIIPIKNLQITPSNSPNLQVTSTSSPNLQVISSISPNLSKLTNQETIEDDIQIFEIDENSIAESSSSSNSTTIDQFLPTNENVCNNCSSLLPENLPFEALLCNKCLIWYHEWCIKEKIYNGTGDDCFYCNQLKNIKNRDANSISNEEIPIKLKINIETKDQTPIKEPAAKRLKTDGYVSNNDSDDEENVPVEERIFYWNMLISGKHLKIGDIIYLTRKNKENLATIDYHKDCDIFRIQHLYRDKSGTPWVYGHHYLRPENIYRPAKQTFFPNEVFSTKAHEGNAPASAVVGFCTVLRPGDYRQGKPRRELLEDIYICEASYDKPNKLQTMFKKGPKDYSLCKLPFAFKRYPKNQELNIRKTYQPPVNSS